jgi:hypothetical protein
MEDPSRDTYREERAAEQSHRHGMPRSWVLVSVVIAAFYAAGIAVIGHHWVLFWACAGLVVLAVSVAAVSSSGPPAVP